MGIGKAIYLYLFSMNPEVIQIIRGVKYSSIALIGWIGLQAYWLELFVYLLLLLFVLSGLDIIYGYYLAHRRKIVVSSVMSDGMLRKLIQLLLSGLWWFSCYVIAHSLNVDLLNVFLSIVAIIPASWFIFAQSTSLIENLAIGANKDEKWIIGLLLKIAGIWRERLVNKAKRYETQ